MLTQQEVRIRFDNIASEILSSPGMYYELYSRLFSERVQFWKDFASADEARVIQQVADRDPDFKPPEQQAQWFMGMSASTPMFNPAWDLSY